MSIRTALAAASCATLATFSAHAGIVNGSFEADALAARGVIISSNLTGWQGGSGGIELRNAMAGTAQDGTRFVELDTRGNSSMWQSVLTDVGQAYELSLWYSPRRGVASDSNAIEVWWDGTLLSTLTGSGVGFADHVWKEYSYSVLGAGNNTLRFVAAGKSDSLGGSLDNVRLRALPEPGSLALVLGALVAGAAVLRRRA